MSLPTRRPRDRFPYPRHPETQACTLALEAGEYVYVQDADGYLWVAPNAPHQHPKILGGAQPVATAGNSFSVTLMRSLK